MSLVTILQNKENIINNIIERTKNNVKQSLFVNQESNFRAQRALEDCLQLQYLLMIENLNENGFRRQEYSKDLQGKKLILKYYSHIYMHNYTAINDEFYEVLAALDKYEKSLKSNDPVKFEKAGALIIEELIDVFHFLMEYQIFLEEHKYFLNYDNVDKLSQISFIYNISTVDYIGPILKRKLLDSAVNTINRYNNIKNTDEDKSKGEIVFTSDPLVVIDFIKDSIYKMLKINQVFIRKTSFKDWKVYNPDTYYNDEKFEELNKIYQELALEYLNLMKNIAKFDILNLGSLKLLFYDFYVNIQEELGYLNKYRTPNPDISCDDLLVIIAGIYMDKNKENVRRQKEDPRYTGKETGNIVGEKV